MTSLLLMASKLLLAGLLGGIVGYEREKHDHPAGLRTHILVCMGSTLIMLISQSFNAANASDPSRIAAQIVSGIGFLGAGTILRQGSIVRGLTTAASLWTVAGIGMAVGIESPFTTYPLLAIIATIIVFVTLSVIGSIDTMLGKRGSFFLLLEINRSKEQAMISLLNNLMSMGVTIDTIASSAESTSELLKWKLRILLPRSINQDSVIHILASETELERFELRQV